MAQHRRATSTGQDSAVHLHLKDKGHSLRMPMFTFWTERTDVLSICVSTGCCKWCLTAVCSHFKWFAVTKPTGSPAMVEPTEDGLKVASSDTCWKMETLATKTDVPGNFPVSTPTKTGNSLATPDEYGLNHSINTGRSETFVENRLYGNVAFSFTALLADGILPENVLHLPKTRTFTLVLLHLLEDQSRLGTVKINVKFK
uniref:Uncharacterized protein n=1 Tax=Maylandia zebra TaxID=106582 RepID=A0A3P9DDW2_9CICH